MNLLNSRTLSWSLAGALVVSALVTAGPASASSHRWTVDVGEVPVSVSATYPALSVTSDTNLLNLSLPAEFDWAPADLDAPAPTVTWTIEQAGAIVGAADDPAAPDTGMLNGFGSTASIDFSTLPTDPPVGSGYVLNIHAVWSQFAPADAGDVVDLNIGFDVTADIDGGDVPIDLTFANATTETRTYDVALEGPLAGGDTLHVSTAAAETPWDWTTGPDADHTWDTKAQVYGGIGIGATDPMDPTQALDGPFAISTPDPTLLVVPLPGVIYSGATTVALTVSSRIAPVSGPVVTARVNVGTSFAGSASALVASTKPVITGTPVFGKTLHATAGTWIPTTSGTWTTGSTTLAYQWYRGSTRITGATGASHVVTVADIGRPLTVHVSATIPGYLRTVVSTTAVVGRPAAAPRATVRPTVVGVVSVGHTVTAKKGTWTLTPTSYRYQWLDNGTAIRSAVASTYRIPASRVGHVLSCRVSAVRAGHTTGTALTAGRRVT
jgi:hypothetical protein